jgi:hypothetical protein
LNASFEVISHRLGTGSAFLDALACQLGRLPEADNPGHILGSGSPIALVMTPVQHFSDSSAFTDVESAYSLRAMYLVGGHRKEIDPQLFDRELDFSNRLNGVGVKVEMPSSV